MMEDTKTQVQESIIESSSGLDRAVEIITAPEDTHGAPRSSLEGGPTTAQESIMAFSTIPESNVEATPSHETLIDASSTIPEKEVGQVRESTTSPSPSLEKGMEVALVTEGAVSPSPVLLEKEAVHVQENAVSTSSSSTTDVEAGAAPDKDAHAPAAARLPTWRLVVLCISLCFGLFLSLMDGTIVATALFSIGDEFNVLGDVNWVALAYTLSYIGCCVIFSSLGDVVGRRNAYMAAFVIFFGFSMGCGFARSLNELIAFRALQGLGGAGLYSLTFVIAPEIVPPKLQQFIGIAAGVVVAVACVMGPLLGGILTHYATWRWCFWINAPVGIIPLAVFVVAWPPADQLDPHARRRRTFRELDFVGCVLIIAASVLTVFAFMEGGLMANVWSTGLFIAPLVVGCCSFVLLFLWQVLVARRWEDSVAAIFPFRLMKRRVYMAGMVITTLAGFPYYVVIYSLPLRFQVVNEKSSLEAGIGLLPMLGATAVGSTIAGALNGQKNCCHQTLMVGGWLMLIGTGLLTTLDPTAHVEAKTYGFQVFVGLGFGLTLSSASILAIMECQIRDAAVATGIIAQVRVLGGSIGIAAASAILGTQQRRYLTGIISAEQLAALENTEASLTPDQLTIVRQTYSDAFRLQMIACAAVSAAFVLVAAFTWRRNPPGPIERRKQQIAEEVERQTKLAIEKAQKAALAQAGEKA